MKEKAAESQPLCKFISSQFWLSTAKTGALPVLLFPLVMTVVPPFAVTVMSPFVETPVSSPMMVIIVVIEGEGKERESECKRAVRIPTIVVVVIIAGPAVTMASPPSAVPAMDLPD